MVAGREELAMIDFQTVQSPSEILSMEALSGAFDDDWARVAVVELIPVGDGLDMCEHGFQCFRPVVRGWHGRDYCGRHLGYLRDGGADPGPGCPRYDAWMATSPGYASLGDVPSVYESQCPDGHYGYSYYLSEEYHLGYLDEPEGPDED